MVSQHWGSRSEPRNKPDKFCYVEFKPNQGSSIYQYRIWDLSSVGLCILVRQDSEILQMLHIDDVLEMNYHSEDTAAPPEPLEVRIRHITLQQEGRFKGHYLVGLLILNAPLPQT